MEVNMPKLESPRAVKAAPGRRRRAGRAGNAPLALAVVLALSLAAASCGRPQEARERPDPLTAVVTGLTGGLQVRPAGKEAWLAGGLAVPLYAGDMIATSSGADLLLSFPDGLVAMAGPDSILRFLAGSRAGRIELTRGRLRLEAGEGTSGLSIETPAATAEASGASFDIDVAPGGTTVLRVKGGTVGFTGAGGRGVTVRALEQSEASPGGSPGAPAPAGAQQDGGLSGGLRSLVELQTDRYFTYEDSRENAETDARSAIAVDPLDAWARVNLGRALLDAGQKAEAGAEFIKAVEIDPRFPQALCGIGKIALVDGDWQRASGFYTEARRSDRTSLEAVFGLGLAALGTGDLAGADRWFKEALEVDSQDARSWVALGFVELLRSDVEAAATDMTSALEIDADFWRAYLGRALAATLSRDRAGAMRELESAAGPGKADPRVLNCLGVRSLREGKAAEASAYFRRLQDAEDSATRMAGFQNTGAVALSGGRAKAAAGDLQKSLELVPGTGAYLDLAAARLDLGEYVTALEASAGALACDPSCWYCHELQATVYLEAGMPVEAAAAAQRALELNPRAWVSRAVLGIAMVSTGAAAQARSEFTAALEYAPGEAATASELGFLGAAYQGAREFEKALEAYRDASKAANGDGSYHRYAGDVLAAMERESDALEEYREALRLDPSDENARISVASILRAGGDREKAERELLTGIDRDGDSASLRRVLAENLLEDGDAPGALVHLEAARSIPGLPPGVLAQLLVLEGNAHDHTEDFLPAIDAYALAVAHDPSRGDAWFYMAGDLERAGRPAEAKAAYERALELCRPRPEWQKFHAESAAKLNLLR